VNNNLTHRETVTLIILTVFALAIALLIQFTAFEMTDTYYAPPVPNNNKPPPFDSAPTEGNSLPIRRFPVGAHLYRQTFTHPIICPPKRPR
jgi:hypothetical protein